MITLYELVPDPSMLEMLLEQSPELRAVQIELDVFAYTPSPEQRRAWTAQDWEQYDATLEESAMRLRELLPLAQQAILALTEPLRQNPDGAGAGFDDAEDIQEACEAVNEGLIQAWYDVSE